MASSLDPATKIRLETLFPLLTRTRYALRSRPDNRYNCIAWVLGITTEWWWPDPRSYWPVEPRIASVDGFTKAFHTVAFEPCANPDFEAGFSKIVLYIASGRPTHAAKIETPTLWTSKLGRAELVEHEPNALNGITYGLPSYFFRKKV
jgi:hypothetical protein